MDLTNVNRDLTETDLNACYYELELLYHAKNMVEKYGREKFNLSYLPTEDRIDTLIVVVLDIINEIKTTSKSFMRGWDSWDIIGVGLALNEHKGTEIYFGDQSGYIRNKKIKEFLNDDK